MVDVVFSQVLLDGTKTAIMKFTNVSDATGEAAVTKVDPALLAKNGNRPCVGVTITKIWYSIAMGVDIFWDGSPSPQLAIALIPDNMGELDFRDIGGLINNANNKTGLIKFTTVGAVALDRYTIILEMQKNY